MNVSETRTRSIIAREIPGYEDPVHINLVSDTQTGICRVEILGDTATSVASWVKLPQGQTLEQMITSAPVSFLLGKFDPFNTLRNKVDHDTLTGWLQSDLTRKVEAGELTAERAVELSDWVTKLPPVTDINGVFVMHSGYFNEVYGPGWTTDLQADLLGKARVYVKLSRHIEVLKEVVSQLEAV